MTPPTKKQLDELRKYSARPVCDKPGHADNRYGCQTYRYVAALLADHERLGAENARLQAACPCRVARHARTEEEVDKLIGETAQECRRMDRETLISHYACSLANQDAALDELEKARAENARLRGLLERWSK